MAANDSKSYLSYFNKLVAQYNNTYCHSINKKPINADYSIIMKKLQPNPKVPKFWWIKVWELQSTRIFLEEATLKFGQEKYL